MDERTLKRLLVLYLKSIGMNAMNISVTEDYEADKHDPRGRDAYMHKGFEVKIFVTDEWED